MTNPYYGRGSAIAPFVLADARDVANEFAAVEAGFDGVTAALTENRLASNSTTSLAIATGAKTLLIGTGRAFAVGQFVSIARTADPTNFMAGQVTSYNATTGVLAVNVTETGGSGTYAEWTIALSLPGSTATFLRKTGDTMAGPLNLAGDPATDAEAARKAYVDAVTTAAAMLAKMMTVDGSGSGLDADMLDGLHASAFARLSGAIFTGDVNVVGAGGRSAGMNTNGDITANRGDNTGVYYFTATGTRYLYFNGGGFDLIGGQLAINSYIAWNAGNDGSGSGLDADYLDGLDSTQFLRANANVFNHRSSGANGYLQFNEGNGANPGYVSFHTVEGIRRGFVGWNNGASRMVLASETGWGWAFYDTPFVGALPMWHAGNDGAGSGLDADLLDGYDSSYFVNIPARLGYTPVQQGGGVGQGNNKVHIGWSGSRLKAQVDSSDQGNIVFDSHVADVWRASNDGAGSGLDADLLDGLDSNYFTNIAARLGYTPLNQASYTAADVMAKVQSLDGSGSGLDADLLDGLNSTAFSRVVDASLTESPGFEVYANGKVAAWGYVDVAQDSYANVSFPTRSGGGALFTSWVNVTLGAQTRLGVNEAENTGFSGSPTTSGFTIFNAQNQTIRVWWQAVGL